VQGEVAAGRRTEYESRPPGLSEHSGQIHDFAFQAARRVIALAATAPVIEVEAEPRSEQSRRRDGRVRAAAPQRSVHEYDRRSCAGALDRESRAVTRSNELSHFEPPPRN
jgi:hypothetical protein